MKRGCLGLMRMGRVGDGNSSRLWIGKTSEVQMMKKKMVGWVGVVHGWKFDGWMMCMCMCMCMCLAR